MRGYGAIAIACAAGACACGPRPAPPPGVAVADGPPVAVTLALVIGDEDAGLEPAPAILAYQDGDGPWRPLADVPAQTFEVRAGRYGVLAACSGVSPIDSVSIVYRAVAETTAPELWGCARPRAPRAVVEGALVGGAGRAMAAAGHGLSRPAGVDRYRIEVPPGRRDVIVQIVEGRIPRGPVRTLAAAIVRGVEVAGGTALDIDVGAVARPTVAIEAAVEGDAGEPVEWLALWVTPRRATALMTRASGPPHVYDAPPPELWEDGDRVVVVAQVAAPDRSTRAVRLEDPAPGARFVIPPPLGDVEVRAAPGAPHAIEAAWPRYTDDATYLLLLQSGRSGPDAWVIDLSPGWLGAHEVHAYRTPDLGGVPGAAALAPDASGLRWTLTAHEGGGQASRTGALPR